MNPRTVARPLLVAALPALAGCGLLFQGAPRDASDTDGAVERGERGPDPAAAAVVPAGYGTLRQDDVTVTVVRADLQIKVTPLAEEIIRVTAPDTYERLSALGQDYRETLERRYPGLRDAPLFLVSLFTDTPDVTFEPEELNLLSRGFRYRPLAILAVTPGWTGQRLQPRRTEMAVYAFDSGLDLEMDLEVEYREARNRSWERILRSIEAERARVRARARGGS